MCHGRCMRSTSFPTKTDSATRRKRKTKRTQTIIHPPSILTPDRSPIYPLLLKTPRLPSCTTSAGLLVHQSTRDRLGNTVCQRTSSTLTTTNRRFRTNAARKCLIRVPRTSWPFCGLGIRPSRLFIALGLRAVWTLVTLPQNRTDVTILTRKICCQKGT